MYRIILATLATQTTKFHIIRHYKFSIFIYSVSSSMKKKYIYISRVYIR